MYASFRRLLVTALVAGSACAGGCYHIKTGGPVTPPTGFTFSPGQPTPTPSGTCQQQNFSAAIIEVSPDILPTKDPTYGTVGEYVLAPASGSRVPGHAAVIRLTSGSLVQFPNVDTAVIDSAVGLGTTGFPNTPHSFPGGTQNPVGSAIGGGTWSTGRMGAASASTACFSQTLTLPTVGTGQRVSAYFGDYDLYNTITNGEAYRNVIVVSGAARTRYNPVRIQVRTR